MIGIYAIRNTMNEKMYIGESIDINKRWKCHQETLDNNCHYNYKLQQDWNATCRKQFRFIILEEFVFPFREIVDSIKLQLTLFCREFYYMKKYQSKSLGYNIENTLKEVLKNSNKYTLYNTVQCKDFIRNNQDVLLTDSFDLNILNKLCIYSENTNIGEKLYINANSSPQTITPYYTSYFDKKYIVKHKDKTDSNNKSKTKMKTKKDESLIPRSYIYNYFEEDFISTYTSNILYYKDIQDGFLTYIDNKKYHYALTDKGLNSGYYAIGNCKVNGHRDGQLLLTQSGVQYYINISKNILEYLPKNKIYKNEKNKYTIDII
ncbi:MAG: GIY-YIG nuclease family protein [Bacteroidales bacterium]|nr:GIY-YIG nuclease family protein [Bacteroidales bacterium]